MKISPFLLCGMLLAQLLPFDSAPATLDDDANGLSDVWEAAYKKGQSLPPNDDTDGDGVSNWKESMAGTDPRNPWFILRVNNFTIEGANIRIKWPTTSGKIYQLQVATSPGDNASWRPIAAAVMGDGAEVDLSLPLATTIPTGSATYTRWLTNSAPSSLAAVRTLAAGGTVTNLTVSATETGQITTLERPQTSPDLSNYGQWIRGWIVPPANGNYTFWIAGDDNCDFSLSTDASQTNKSVIAKVDGNPTNYTGRAEWTKYASQQSSPPRALQTGRAYYFEVFHGEGGGGDHVEVAWTGPGIPTQQIIPGNCLSLDGLSLAQLQGAGGGVFFRVAVTDIDTDGDGLNDYEEKLLGYDATTATTVPRVNDKDAIRSALAAPNTVTAGASVARAYESTAAPGSFTLFRSGNLNPLTISYTITGTATSGPDFAPLSGSVTIPVGKNSATVSVAPVNDGILESAETVILQIASSANYTLGNPTKATVTIDDAPDVLYVAPLRALSGVRSGGQGNAVFRVAGNKVFATLGVSFGNLTTAETEAEMYVSTSGAGPDGMNVLALPLGQIASLNWGFTPAAGYTSAQIIAALEAGQLYARINSTRFPNVEITGKFVREQAYQTMPTPATPPAAPTAATTDADAARFLTQATFGPTAADMASVRSLGYAAWIDQQFAKSATRHLPYVQARRAELLARDPNNDGWQRPRQEGWWQVVLKSDDQLRQRVAFALSEIFVVSDVGVLDGSHEGITNYYDLLVDNAFGNYRQLLEKVTLSPIMGQYLSMVRNRKPDPVTGSEPDENYAREVMQLFSIGLNQLHPDGSIKLNSEGFPLTTYTQADTVGLAHVFTGWSYAYTGNEPNFFYGPKNEMLPMVQYTANGGYHDTAAKTIVGNTAIPAGQTPAQDLAMAMDTLANHPNVGPFICRQIIQRLVTSNPSPGYIYRAAQVFGNNGQGVRGDLKAVVKAILLDYEARSPDLLTDQTYGKLREPLLRVSHLLRAFPATLDGTPATTDGRLFLDLEYSSLGQSALKSGSVFNFFQPGYIPPGRFAAAGLFGPEFQTTSETTVVGIANELGGYINWGIWTSELDSGSNNRIIRISFAEPQAILDQPTTGSLTVAQKYTQLIDFVNARLTNGRMSQNLRTEITQALNAYPAWASNADKARAAVQLAITSPEYTVQR